MRRASSRACRNYEETCGTLKFATFSASIVNKVCMRNATRPNPTAARPDPTGSRNHAAAVAKLPLPLPLAADRSCRACSSLGRAGLSDSSLCVAHAAACGAFR